jgi:hypothetical protein
MKQPFCVVPSRGVDPPEARPNSATEAFLPQGDADATLRALVATGMLRREAMAAMIESGVPRDAFPVLEHTFSDILWHPAGYDFCRAWIDTVGLTRPAQANALLDLLLEGRRLDGNLGFENRPWLTSLPSDLDIGGDLKLTGKGFRTLGLRLKVGGALRLVDTGITTLPDNLDVGRLHVENGDLVALPRGLRVATGCHLTGCPQWDGRIPPDASIGGPLVTQRHPHSPGVSLQEWRKRHPHGEKG